MATVTAGARLHFGFLNLSLAHARLYGGLGVALEEPRFVVTAEPAETVHVDTGKADVEPTSRSGGGTTSRSGVGQTAGSGTAPSRERVVEYARRSCSLLSVPGAAVTVEESLPRHVGLGSGTQLALAVYAAVAQAHDCPADVRTAAPALGRGGRSGVGVAGFEAGGFVLDAGHPTARFTTDRPADGDWTVPAVAARHELPDDWQFVVVVPEADPGRCGEHEEASMRRVVERADPAIADDISGVVTRRLLPAAADGRLEAFGDAVAEVGRLNGAWYADAQGGVFRPPVGTLVEHLSASPAVAGAGQSSWGPAVYGLTDRDHAGAAVEAAEEGLAAAGVEGSVRVVAVRNEGCQVDPA